MELQAQKLSPYCRPLSELKIRISLDQLFGPVVLKAYSQLAIFTLAFDFDNGAEPVLRVPHARANQRITICLPSRSAWRCTSRAAFSVGCARPSICIAI